MIVPSPITTATNPSVSPTPCLKRPGNVAERHAGCQTDEERPGRQRDERRHQPQRDEHDDEGDAEEGDD